MRTNWHLYYVLCSCCIDSTHICISSTHYSAGSAHCRLSSTSYITQLRRQQTAVLRPDWLHTSRYELYLLHPPSVRTNWSLYCILIGCGTGSTHCIRRLRPQKYRLHPQYDRLHPLQYMLYPVHWLHLLYTPSGKTNWSLNCLPIGCSIGSAHCTFLIQPQTGFSRR